MAKQTDIRVFDAELYLIPVPFRVPLKFGRDTTTEGTCARVKLTVEDRHGRRAEGWGESPLAVNWGWPSKVSYACRHERMASFCRTLTQVLPAEDAFGHPLELGSDFQANYFKELLEAESVDKSESMPQLAALLCLAPLDLALHDAFGQLHQVDTYDCYSRKWMSRDLSHYFADDHDAGIDFSERYPSDYLVSSPPTKLPAWHLVGGLDPLDASELNDDVPCDGLPVTLIDWIEQDQLNCLKIKLRGNDESWDYARIVKVGLIAIDFDVRWLSLDFNCTVIDPEYVNQVLDRLLENHLPIWQRVSYIEQPFPYDLDAHPIDVRSVSKRKPLFLDESAHDWRFVKKGRELGWSGVALKTCKTQTGALLSLCWAKAHGMPLMVQDLTNPMLAQIPHVRLAAHAGTIHGVETNSMQFSPAASVPEAKIHTELYRRRCGVVDLLTLGNIGFGYRLQEIDRPLPPVDTRFAGSEVITK